MQTHENCSTILTCFNDYFILSRDPLFRGSVKLEKQEVMSSNRKTEYNGFMSPATTRKVRVILTTWIKSLAQNPLYKPEKPNSKKRKLTFVTLTLSDKQVHTDNEIKRKMLNRFLIKVQRSHGVKYYFWRAEKQKNGNIHFHVILDSFIDKRVIQTAWNNIQMDFGYMDNYFSKHKHFKSPSTHVGILSSMSDAVSYVLKYVCKNPTNLKDKNLKVEGRIWSCSKELKELKPYSISEDKPLISRLYHEAKQGKIEALEADFFTIFRCDTKAFLQKYFKRVLYEYNFYYNQVYLSLYINPKTKITPLVPSTEDSIKLEPIYTQAKMNLFTEDVLIQNRDHYSD